ncbi:MAG: serine hydrolase domain-containing protein [Kangiellaceae bacterium]
MINKTKKGAHMQMIKSLLKILIVVFYCFNVSFVIAEVEKETKDSDSLKQEKIGQITIEDNSSDDKNKKEKTAPSNIQELKEALAELIEYYAVPAVGIAMLDETGPVWIGSLGKANFENEIAADENSLYRIGSTSKMFVALSVLKLVEEGKLSLNDKVRELVPEIEFENKWAETHPILVSHLLEHTTGWDDLHLTEYAHNDPTPVTLKQGLDFHPHSRVSRWMPGSRSSYCNSGPPVAAYIVQKISGIRFEDYVEKNFFKPIGMSRATYFLNDDVKQQGVTLYNNGNKPQDYWHISMRPSGSINASPTDMAKFLEFYLNRGEVEGNQIISSASLERMERAETTNASKAGQQTGYGLNNYSSPHKSWVYREHNGGVNGGLTELAYLPSAKVGHAIMINSGNGEAFGKISDLIRDYETRNLEPLDISNEAVITDEHKQIEGFYFPINPRQQMGYFLERIANMEKFYFDGNTLVRTGVLGGNPAKYIPQSATLYRSGKTGLVSLSVANDPLVGKVIHANNRVLQPISSGFVYAQISTAFIWVFFIVSSFLYVLIWGIRKLNKSIPSGATIRIRMWPLFAGICIFLVLILFSVGASEPFINFGKPSFISVSIMLLTIAFALFSVMGVYTAFKERRSPMNQVNYWYCSLGSLVNLIVTVYFLWFGVIGLMTWG